MPPHKLILKKGMPVMLLRNLDPKNGHCNGVKYVVTFMADHVIEVISISGTNTGKKTIHSKNITNIVLCNFTILNETKTVPN